MQLWQIPEKDKKTKTTLIEALLKQKTNQFLNFFSYLLL